MIYVLVVAIAFWLASLRFSRAAGRSADDWIGQFLALVAGAIALVLAVAYLALAVWFHRFL